MVLGLIAFLPRLAHPSKPGQVVRPRVWAAVGGLLFFLFILLVAQSRGAWLSLGLGLIGLAVAGFARRRRAKPGTPPIHRRQLLLPAILCVAAMGGLWSLFGDALQARFASEANVLPQVMAMDMEHLPYSNGPARIHLAVWGIRMAAERPLFGWGPGMRTTAYLGEHGFHGSPSKFLRVVRHFEHLHDVYIEILVRFGLVGAALFLAAFVLFSRTLLSQWKRRILPDDFFAFAAVVIVATLFSGLYEFRTLHIDFRFFALLFGGAVYTFALHRPVAPKDAATGTAHPTPRGVP
jgi:O-antigen ligase